MESTALTKGVVVKIWVVLLVFSQSVFASEFRLRWSINSELEYFIETSKEFKARVEDRTKGRVKVDVSLIKADQEKHDHLADVVEGRSDMGQEFVHKLKQYAPGLEVWDIPYYFKSDDHVEAHLRSPEAQQHLAALASVKKVTPLGYSFSGGFIYLYGHAPVRNLTELRGKHLYLEPSSQEYVRFLTTEMSASTAPATSADTGSPGPASVFEIIAGVADELFDRSDRDKLVVTKSNHRVISRIVVISDKFLAGLPEDLRHIVIEEGRLAAERERGITLRQRDRFLSLAKARGVRVVEPDTTSANEKSARERISRLYTETYTASGKRVQRSISRSH